MLINYVLSNSAKEVMFLMLCVCVFYDYGKTTDLISMKLGGRM